MKYFWESSWKDTDFYNTAFNKAEKLRNNITKDHTVAIRKTFNLSEPGCNVNCEFCSLAQKYVNVWNNDKIIDNDCVSILDYSKNYPELTNLSNIELVLYRNGIEYDDIEYARLRKYIELVKSMNYPLIGGDFGVISKKETIYDLKEAGLDYIHNNIETNGRLYPVVIGKNERRMEKKMETLSLAYENGLDITSGLLLGVGENADDLIEEICTMRELPAKRVNVNFMNCTNNERIGKIFSHASRQHTPEYAIHSLVFVRNYIRNDQSLIVGCGINRYLSENISLLEKILRIADTIHLGSFTNIEGNSKSHRNLMEFLKKVEYEIVGHEYFFDNYKSAYRIK